MSPDPSTLTTFDIAALVFIGLSMLFAFGKGFVTAALGLGAWVGAFFLTAVGFALITPWMRDTIQPDELADIISFVVLFFVALFILKQIAGWIGTAVKTSFAGLLDRSLGALFGMLRGFVIICIVYMGTTALFPGKKQPEWIRDAQLRPVVHFGAEMITELARAMLGDRNGKDAQDLLDRVAKATPTQFIAERLEEETGALVTKESQKKLDELIGKVSEEADKKKDGA